MLPIGGGTEAQSTPDLGVKGEPVAGALGKIGLTSTSGLSDLGRYGTLRLNLRRGRTWTLGCGWGKEGTRPE